MKPFKKQILYPAAILAVFIMSSSASAGLFGSIGSALGIGGDAGKVLGFADGLLPGGGGATDQFLGAGAKGVLGPTIDKWKQANDDSIDKLGRTNDATVQKLVAGLGQNETQIDAIAKGNISLFSDSLLNAISNLDTTLHDTISQLDESLNSTTLRLDVVLQKQIDNGIFLLKITFSFLVGLIAFASLSRIVTQAGPDRTLYSSLQHDYQKVISISVISLLAIIIVWIWPIKLASDVLENRFEHGYSEAFEQQDYVWANYNASQLSLLNPTDDQIRGQELKAQAFRDIFNRPTVLMDDDKFHSYQRMLVKADNYSVKATNHNDPDVLLALSLLAVNQARSREDLIRASILIGEVKYQASSQDNRHVTKTTDPSATAAREAISDVLTALSNQGVDIQLARTAVGPEGASAISSIMNDFPASTLSGTSSGDVAFVDVNTESAYPLTAMSSAAVERSSVSKFYDNLSAFYAAAIIGKISKATPQDIDHAACSGLKYYQHWKSQVQGANGGHLEYTAAVLSGKFVILKRLKGMLSDPNRCDNSTYDNLKSGDIDKLVDVPQQWADLAMSYNGGGVKNAGIHVLLAAARNLEATQDHIFDDFEQSVSALARPDTLQDSELIDIRYGNSVVRLQKTPDPQKLAGFLSDCARLNLYVTDSTGRNFPLLGWAFSIWGKDVLPDDLRQTLAQQYLMGPI